METYKQGFVHPETGLVFWSRQKSCKNGERWMAVEKFNAKRKLCNELHKTPQARERIKKRRNTDNERAKRNAYAKIWRKNPDVLMRVAAYARKRRKTNILACISGRIRARLSEAIRTQGYSKGLQTEQMLGCSWEELKSHIESKFKEGMDWGNRALWHIDHVIPLASAKNQKELMELANYKNLQPLWAVENFKKGATLDQAIYLKRAMEEMDK
jgi:hypothetical protein